MSTNQTTRPETSWALGCVLILLGLSVEMAPYETCVAVLSAGTALALKSIMDGWNE